MWQEIGIRLSALLYCSIRGKYPPPLIRGKNRFFKNTIFLLFQNHRTMVHFSKCSENNPPPPFLRIQNFQRGGGGDLPRIERHTKTSLAFYVPFDSRFWLLLILFTLHCLKKYMSTMVPLRANYLDFYKIHKIYSLLSYRMSKFTNSISSFSYKLTLSYRNLIRKFLDHSF